MRRTPVALLCWFLLATTSCGPSNLAEVRGKITLDGNPLANAFVVFAPTQSGTTSYGKTDTAGEYRMTFTDRQSGAWLGENLVRVSTGDLGSDGRPAPKELVPVVYNKQTTLKVEVKPGQNAFNFDLKSTAGKVIQGPVE